MPIALVIVIIVAIISWGAWIILPWLLKRRGVSMRRTRFGLALIFDSTDEDGTPVRLLNVNGVYQSVCYIPHDLRFELCCMYHRHMAEILAHAQSVSQVMVIGGGGYSLPKYLVVHEQKLHCDVVEIDPAVTRIAREFFFLDECLEKIDVVHTGRMQLIEGDGWEVLRSASTPYDVIINDAFSGSKPLGPLTTDEGARLVHEKLVPGGIYLANVRSAIEGRKATPLQEVLEAFSEEFLHVAYVPDAPEHPKDLGYNAFIASDRDLWLPQEAVVIK